MIKKLKNRRPVHKIKISRKQHSKIDDETEIVNLETTHQDFRESEDEYERGPNLSQSVQQVNQSLTLATETVWHNHEAERMRKKQEMLQQAITRGIEKN